MVDIDVRLGLSGSDLAIRERTFRADLTRLAESNLTVEDSPEVKALVEAGYGTEIVASKRFRVQDFLTVRKERIVGLLTVLRDHTALEYKLVSDIFGVDLLGFETEPRFEVVYSLYSLKTYQRIVVKAQVSEDDPTIDTTSGVWLAAEWPEREIYDMLGISFNHHADLRRILMPDDWVGHPLRKDFPLGGEEVEFSHNVREQAK
ncbi:NADH-quinone oxidoreductase subunit C [Armatimonas sp.]|uniref:NADH-quinone oxidoreductase subunit C n=1 Tax=Armatimonas sp. TaxID=1872638 RepID=UPI00286BF434|nr:NADH-quinone oxidoreductase subunit C [Armatimonas sp.]